MNSAVYIFFLGGILVAFFSFTSLTAAMDLPKSEDEARLWRKHVAKALGSWNFSTVLFLIAFFLIAMKH